MNSSALLRIAAGLCVLTLPRMNNVNVDTPSPSVKSGSVQHRTFAITAPAIDNRLLGFQPILPRNTTGLTLKWQGVEARHIPGWVMTYEAKYTGVHDIDVMEWRAKQYYDGWGERVIQRQPWNGTVIKFEYDNPQANRWDNKIVEYERNGVYYQVWGNSHTTFAELLPYLKGLVRRPSTRPNMIHYQATGGIQNMRTAISIMPFPVVMPSIPSSYHVSFIDARRGSGLIQPPLTPPASTVDANQIQISFLSGESNGVQVTEAYRFSSYTLQNIAPPYTKFKSRLDGQWVTVYQHPPMQGSVAYDVVWKSGRTGLQYWVQVGEPSPSTWTTSTARKMVESVVKEISRESEG